MRGKAALILLAVLPPVLSLSPARAEGPKIVSVAVEGNVRVDRSSIDRVLPFRPGEAWDEDKATEGVKAVYRLGSFSRVEVEERQAGDGMEVIVRVREFPAIVGVSFEGNHALSVEELKKTVTLRSFGFYDPADFPSQAALIRKAYEAKGYYEVKVSPRGEETAKGIRVVFALDEGEKTLVSELDILGNRALDDRTVKGAMETGEKGPLSWLSSSGVLEKEKLALDLDRIRILYYDRGYLDVKVEEPVIRMAAEGDGLYVGIRVDEGRQYHVGGMTFSGDWAGLVDLQPTVTFRRGEVLERSHLMTQVKALEDAVKDRGYARAKVTPGTRLGGEEGVVDLDLNLSRGSLVRVRFIHIRGNRKTRDYVIRRELHIEEGDLYSQKDVDESVRRVRALGFLPTVEIHPQDIPGNEEAVDLVVTVQEGSSGTLSAGFAYSSNEGLVGTIQHSQRNLFGRGQRLVLNAEFGSKSTTYDVSFTEPRVFSSRFSLGVDLYDLVREYSNYKEATKGGNLRLGYKLGDDSSASLRFRRSQFNIYDVDPSASDFIQRQAGESSTAAVRIGYSYDTRDYPFDPRTGTSLDLSVEAAGGALGGSNDFISTELEGAVFHPLAGDLVGSAHLDMGIINPYHGKEVPVTERFFLGGLSTIRGFEYRKVGPLDEEGQPLGGNKKLQINLEANYPLVHDPNIKGVLFVDAGNVWAGGERPDLGGLRYGVGFGFRWFSPVGPLRLEWGTNMNPRTGERQPGWEFSIGASF